MANVSISEPGRHAALIDDFPDHVRPADHLFERCHGKRGCFARAMAADAVILDDPGDVLAVRRVAVRRHLGDATDQATVGLDHRAADFLARQYFVDRLGQVALGLLAPHVPGSHGLKAILIVDAPPIADDVLAIK